MNVEREPSQWQIPKTFREIEEGNYESEEKFQLLRSRHSYLQDRLAMFENGKINSNEIGEIKVEMEDLEKEINGMQ